MENSLQTVTNARDMVFSGQAMQQLNQLAELMASSKCTVPKHLQGQTGDCFAIAMQAMQWGMNPYAVAQKTHLVNGVLGYEAQLVNAVIQSSNAIKGAFKYEYKGEGENMSCRVGAVLNGDSEITWGEWLRFGSVAVKNSPLWKTNPRQQIGYLQVKNWGRLYCPGAILGVYSDDELSDFPSEKKEVEINPLQSNAELSALEKTLAEIKTMTAEELKGFTGAGLTDSEKATARTAWIARSKELRESAVVADIKPEPEKELSWPERITACKSDEELDALLKEMPEAVQLDLGDEINMQYDSFR